MTNPIFGNVERIDFAWSRIGVDKITVTVNPAVGPERAGFFVAIARLWLAQDLTDLRERAARLADEVGVGVEMTDPHSVDDRQGVRRVIIQVVPALG